jgi:hypothetical protein
MRCDFILNVNSFWQITFAVLPSDMDSSHYFPGGLTIKHA